MQWLKKTHLVENIIYETNNLYAHTGYANYVCFPAYPFTYG
jgi:hypothetical protein